MYTPFQKILSNIIYFCQAWLFGVLTRHPYLRSPSFKDPADKKLEALSQSIYSLVGWVASGVDHQITSLIIVWVRWLLLHILCVMQW